MSEENMKLWEAVQKTDPKHTKNANVKGNKITSIKPQYQILQATKQWGPYGTLWGFKNLQLGYELKDAGLVTFKGTFYYPGGEFESLNVVSIWKDNAKTKIDDDFAKKVETDSLTKSLSKLGFSADIFMGRFDDIKYVQEMNAEFNPPEPEKEPTMRELLVQAIQKAGHKTIGGWCQMAEIDGEESYKALTDGEIADYLTNFSQGLYNA